MARGACLWARCRPWQRRVGPFAAAGRRVPCVGTPFHLTFPFVNATVRLGKTARFNRPDFRVYTHKWNRHAKTHTQTQTQTLADQPLIFLSLSLTHTLSLTQHKHTHTHTHTRTIHTHTHTSTHTMPATWERLLVSRVRQLRCLVPSAHHLERHLQPAERNL